MHDLFEPEKGGRSVTTRGAAPRIIWHAGFIADDIEKATGSG